MEDSRIANVAWRSDDDVGERAFANAVPHVTDSALGVTRAVAAGLCSHRLYSRAAPISRGSVDANSWVGQMPTSRRCNLREIKRVPRAFQAHTVAHGVDKILHQPQHRHRAGATGIERQPSGDFLHALEVD